MRIAKWANFEFPIPNSEIEKWDCSMARIRFANGAPRSRLVVPFPTHMWGDIPAIRWRIPPRPKAVASCWEALESSKLHPRQYEKHRKDKKSFRQFKSESSRWCVRWIGRGDFGLRARGGISLPAVGRRTSSSVPPFLGVYPNSYKFGCERVRHNAA
jgi:hypothetical protein